MSNPNDEWMTPQWLFDELNKEFNFDIDLCATRENSKCNHLCWDFLHGLTGSKDSNCIGTIYDDYEHGLISCGFINPPYSNPKPFIEKAWEVSELFPVICLLPNTIKTCKYMDILDENGGLKTFRKWKPGIEIRDLARRTGFSHPTKDPSSPSFGCMVIVMDMVIIMDRRKL